MTPTKPSSTNKGADAAGGPSPMTAAATLFGTSSTCSDTPPSLNPTKESISANKSNSQTQKFTVQSIDRAKIVMDHATNSMTSIELFKENDSDDSSSDSDNEESSKDGFSDTDGASTSSDEDDENFNITKDDDSDISSAMSDNNGYLQINVDGGTLHVLDGTITSPTTTNNINAKPTPARPRSGAIVDPITPFPSKTSKPAGRTPDASLTPMTVSSTPSTSPPPPPPTSSNTVVQDGDKRSTLEESPHQQQNRSPAPGPFQYPPGIPRHKRDRVLRPSPLPSPAKSARRALWKRNGTGSPSNDGVGPSDASSSASSKKASSAAATILAANMTPGTPKHRKRQVHASGSAANANTPHRSDSSGDNGSSMLMTEEGRRKREEVQLARLVDMAKRQQRFAAAWFATSQGQDAPDVVPPPPPSRHRVSRVGPLAPPEGTLVRSTTCSKSELNFATGPIDADSGEAWRGPRGAPRESGGKNSSPSFHLHSTGHQSLELEPIQSGTKDNGGDAASYVSTSSSKTPKTSNASPDKRGRGRSSNIGGDIERGMTASPSPEGRSDLVIDLSNDESESRKRGGADSFWTREIRIGRCRLAAMNCFVMAVLAVVVAGAAIVGVVSTPGNNVSGPDSVVTDVPSNSIPDYGDSIGPRDDIVPILPADKPTIPGDDWKDDVDIFLRTTEPTRATTPMPTGVLSTIATTSNPTSTPTYRPSPTPSLSHLPSQAPSVVPTSLYQTASFSQIDKTLSGKEAGFQFGYSVALSSDGSVMAVGSRYADDNGPRSGEVRVFVLSPKNKWEQLGKTIKGRNEADQFGFSVALSSDGLTLAASEPGFDGEAGDRSGNVRIFRYNSGEPKIYGTNGSWTKTGDLSGEDSTALFGVSISLSGDGSRLAVGAPYHDSDKLDEMGESLRKAGRVRVFEYTNEWKPLGQPIDGKSPSSWWGWSVDLSVDGDFFAAGAIRHVSGGYVQIYRLENDANSIGEVAWAQLGNDIFGQDALPDGNEGRLDDRFGHSVSLSGNADRIIVGSPNSDLNGKTNAGMAIVYEKTTIDGEDVVWTATGKPIVGTSNNAEAGWSVAISDSSSQIIVGAPGDSTVKDGAGSATSLRWNDDVLDWEPARSLYGGEQDEGYGFSVAISADGNIIGIGAPSGDDDQGFVGAYAY